jgi:hypothetical protein
MGERPMASGRLAEEAERVARALNDSLPPLPTPTGTAEPFKAVETVRTTNADDAARTATAETAATPAATAPAAEAPVPPTAGAAAEPANVAPAAAMADAPAEVKPTGGTRGERHGVIGERVGRLREASVVVLDEAQDDPALRFVLVAVVLFVLFLLILLLSHVLD